MIERVVKSRLTDHLTQNTLFNLLQSAYRKFHSTETVLLSLRDHLIHAVGQQHVTCLCLLDLSAAYDTILLERLSQWFGVHGTVLTWFRSYLSYTSFCVKCSGELSQPHHSCYGVPQGSVLGPLLFSLYTTPLSSLISSFGLNHHLYMLMTPSCSYPSRQPSSVITFPVCRLVLAASQTGWLQICSVSTAQRLNSCCWVKYKVLHFVWVMVSLFFLQPQLAISVLFLIPILPLLTTSLLFLDLVSITFEIFDAFALFSISLLLSLLAHLLFIPGLITVIHHIMVFQKSN